MTGELRIGSTIGGFRVEAELGRGGMGVVYRARRESDGARVALKLVSPALAGDARFRERFRREARLAALLAHPNAVPVLEAGEDADGTLYLAMPYVQGVDLGALIRLEGRLAPGRGVDLVGQVAGALDEAHRLNLVHRDVKPANVLIATEAAGERAYLTDFGLSRMAAASDLTPSGEWLGSLDYVAPERIAGRAADARSDVYSLGCVLHTALTGEPPYRGEDDASRLWAHLNAPPPKPSEVATGIPAGFDAVVARALAKRPEARPASAGELAAEARAALAGHAVRAPEPDTQVPAGSPPHRTRTGWLAAGVALGLVAGLAVLGIVLLDGDPEPEPSAPEADRAAPSFETLRTTAYEVDVPADWEVIAKDQPRGEPAGSFMRTELTSPDLALRLAIDRVSGEGLPPGELARLSERDLRDDPGYRRVRFEPTTIGGRSAFAWEFVAEDAALGRVGKVDYFVAIGGRNYAVLGTWPRGRADDRIIALLVARRAVSSIDTATP